MNSSLQIDFVSRAGEPTDAPPGSTRKIRVLMERAERREALFHPGDNQKRAAFDPDEVEEDSLLDFFDIDLAS